MVYYRRRITGGGSGQVTGGGRVQNRFYDLCEDPLILAAIHYLEREEERCIAYQNELLAAKWET